MKTNIISIGTVLSSALIFVSCTKEPLSTQFSANSDQQSNFMTAQAVSITGGTGNTVTLYAGQTINVGSLSFDDIDTNGDKIDDALVITYNLTNGWELVDVALWIGPSLTTLPVNKAGNPVVGQFPYKASNLAGKTSFSITVPFANLSYIPGPDPVSFFVAAHASVRILNGSSYQNETAWGDGLRLVQRGNWAMYFNITLTKDPESEPKKTVTETAFAYSPIYSAPFDPNRWGWTNGPLSAGKYTFDFYAGAAQNILSKGKLVGTVTLVYDGSKATVTYKLNSPYQLVEAHLYLGSEILPRDNKGEYTIAPGKYGNIASGLNGATQYIFNVSGLSGQIYMVAHATVSGF